MALNVDFHVGWEQRKHLEFLLQFRPAYEGSLDKTRASVVLFPGLQRIFLKAMTSGRKQVNQLGGYSFRGTTEGSTCFCLLPGGVSLPALTVLLALIVTLRSLLISILLSPATLLQHVANCMECEKGHSVSLLNICAQRNQI